MGLAGNGLSGNEAARIGQCLDFAAHCSGDTSLDELIRDFTHVAGKFGFTASACGASVTAGSRRTTRFFFCNWPADWQDIYVSRDWSAHDLMMTEAVRKMRPYSWEEARNGRKLTATENEVYVAARRYGWVERFAVPIHGPGGYQGVVTLDAKESCNTSVADRILLQVMALPLHERCRKERFQQDHPGADLTKREIECIKWVAAGKTDWEIGQLLGLAEPTAHFHVERAKKKLNARTRAQAVALLVLQGLL
jgi:LuxR family quorum sensing-dependent transcriptional regulator